MMVMKTMKLFVHSNIMKLPTVSPDIKKSKDLNENASSIMGTLKYQQWVT
jgi:hypothetical protein